jgi:hypothetical protein
MPKLHYSRATTGEKVAECLLDPADAGLIGDLVYAATQNGAGLLWVHSRADLSGAGFTARPGFHEFRADPCPPGGEELPVLPDEVVLGLLPRTFTPTPALTTASCGWCSRPAKERHDQRAPLPCLCRCPDRRASRWPAGGDPPGRLRQPARLRARGRPSSAAGARPPGR